MSRMQKFAPTLALILFPLLFIGSAVFSGQTIGAFDAVAAMGPWQKTPPSAPWDVLQADSVLQFAVWRDLVFTSWSQFVVPTWNPYALAGTPLLENSQSGALYPPHILVGLLRVPYTTGIDLLAWFHLAMAGLGVARLVRAFGGCPLGALFAGLAFLSTPFLLRWTPLASVPTTVCWIPWLLAGVVELGQTPSMHSARERMGSPGFLIAVIATAMLLLGGHLQFAAYGLGAALFVLGWTSLQRYDKPMRREPLPRLLGGAIALSLGLMIAMGQLLPILDYSQFSHRRNTPTEAGYQAYVGLALPAQEILQRLALPMGQGNPNHAIANLPSAPEYWPAVTKPGANYAESASTIGLLAIGLMALLAFRRDELKPAWVMVTLAILGWLLASGSELNRVLYFGVPGWSSTGSPGRAIVLTLIGFLVCSGLALSSLLRSMPSKNEILGMIAGTGIVGLLALSVPMDAKVADFDPEATLRQSILMANLSHVALGLILVAGLLFGIVKAQKHVWAFAIGLCGLWAIGTETFRLVPSGDAALYQLPSDVGKHDRIAAINESWTFIGIPRAQLPPNTPSLLRARDIGGYDSLLHRDTVALLAAINGGDAAPPANGNMMFVKPSALESALREAGVRFVIGRAGVMTEIGGSRLSDNASWIEDSPGRLIVRVEGSGVVVIKERNIRGWQAFSNGKPLSIGGTTWLEVEGASVGDTVTLVYSPPRLSTGLLISALGFLLFGIFRVGSRQSGLKSVEP